MKTLVNLGFVFFLCVSSLFAQRTETIMVTGKEVADFIAKETYKFPSFTRAKVYLKSGEIASGRFNYDYFNELIKYIDGNGDTLAISNVEDINCISAGADTFFYDNRYYEWVASSANARLAVRRTLKLTHKEKVGAYGISSPTINVDNHDMILEITNQKLDKNEVLVFSKQTAYFISQVNGHFTEANKKNFNKLFPGRDIEEFIDQNKLNLNKEEDLLDVFVYASKPK